MRDLHLIRCNALHRYTVLHRDYRKNLSHLNFYQFTTDRFSNDSESLHLQIVTFPISFFEWSISETLYTEWWWWWKDKFFTKFCNLSTHCKLCGEQNLWLQPFFLHHNEYDIQNPVEKYPLNENDQFDLAHIILQ